VQQIDTAAVLVTVIIKLVMSSLVSVSWLETVLRQFSCVLFLIMRLSWLSQDWWERWRCQAVSHVHWLQHL